MINLIMKPVTGTVPMAKIRGAKDTFVARRTLEVAVASAVIHFNDGGCDILNVIEK